MRFFKVISALNLLRMKNWCQKFIVYQGIFNSTISMKFNVMSDILTFSQKSLKRKRENVFNILCHGQWRF